MSAFIALLGAPLLSRDVVLARSPRTAQAARRVSGVWAGAIASWIAAGASFLYIVVQPQVACA